MDSGSVERRGRLLIRTYTAASYKDLLDAYWREANRMAGDGYQPVGQHYVEGNWGNGAVALSVLAVPLFIGIAGIAYMAANKPTGTLTVTYVLR